MLSFLNNIKKKARKNPKRIVFPEGFEPRILKATEILQKEKTCMPILLGKIDELKKIARSKHIRINWEKITVIDPENSVKTAKYAKELYKLRAQKGMSEKQAAETIRKVNYFATMMVHKGDADGMISGTTWSTADTVRPALQIIKTKKKFHKVSGFFFMILNKRVLLFADCAITIEPNSYDLAEIALDTAETAKRFGLKPKIAMLSFSTNGSARHPEADRIREATEIAESKNPALIIEGEMQVDAALVPEICAHKFPGSKLQGEANVLIFPSLGAANIAYKLVERLGGFQAIGPILQGLKKPVNDLSRGCSVQDIVNLAAITTVEAQHQNFR